MRSRPRSSGFTLLELIMMIALFATITLIAGHVYSDCIKAIRHTQQFDNAGARLDHCLSILREDVSRARRIESTDDQHVTLDLGDGRRITWSAVETTLARESQQGDAPPERAEWKQLPPATLHAGRAAVAIQFTDRGRSESIDCLAPLCAMEAR